MYPGTTIVRARENYTSMTCGVCGTQNKDLKGAKVFWCDKCGLECHRDIHAARNMLFAFQNDIVVKVTNTISEDGIVEIKMYPQ